MAEAELVVRLRELCLHEQELAFLRGGGSLVDFAAAETIEAGAKSKKQAGDESGSEAVAETKQQRQTSATENDGEIEEAEAKAKQKQRASAALTAIPSTPPPTVASESEDEAKTKSEGDADVEAKTRSRATVAGSDGEAEAAAVAGVKAKQQREARASAVNSEGEGVAKAQKAGARQKTSGGCVRLRAASDGGRLTLTPGESSERYRRKLRSHDPGAGTGKEKEKKGKAKGSGKTAAVKGRGKKQKQKPKGAKEKETSEDDKEESDEGDTEKEATEEERKDITGKGKAGGRGKVAAKAKKKKTGEKKDKEDEEPMHDEVEVELNEVKEKKLVKDNGVEKGKGKGKGKQEKEKTKGKEKQKTKEKGKEKEVETKTEKEKGEKKMEKEKEKGKEMAKKEQDDKGKKSGTRQGKTKGNEEKDQKEQNEKTTAAIEGEKSTEEQTDSTKAKKDSTPTKHIVEEHTSPTKSSTNKTSLEKKKKGPITRQRARAEQQHQQEEAAAVADEGAFTEPPAKRARPSPKKKPSPHKHILHSAETEKEAKEKVQVEEPVEKKTETEKPIEKKEKELASHEHTRCKSTVPVPIVMLLRFPQQVPPPLVPRQSPPLLAKLPTLPSPLLPPLVKPPTLPSPLLPLLPRSPPPVFSTPQPRPPPSTPLRLSPFPESSAVAESEPSELRSPTVAIVCEEAERTSRALQRVEELKAAGLWRQPQLQRAASPPRSGKVHWDYVLEEMQTVAKQVGEQRKNNLALARKRAHHVVKAVRARQSKVEREQQVEQAQLRKVAHRMARMVKGFWAQIEKVVLFKQQMRIQEKRSEAMSKHLDLVIDHTERLSQMLAQDLSRRPSSVSPQLAVEASAPAAQVEAGPEPVHLPVGEETHLLVHNEDEDREQEQEEEGQQQEEQEEEFVCASEPSSDDESTMADAELIEGAPSGDAELALLQDDVSRPVEDVVLQLAAAAPSEPLPPPPPVSPPFAEGAAQSDKERIEQASALASEAQPTGTTLSTTQVKTPVPFLLRHTLREYQHIGLDWLVSMYEKRLNGILADEMGLGKTVMTISLLSHLACEKHVWGPHLIIVPSSTMLNWELELKKWCPGFKVLTYYGSQKERAAKRKGWSKPNAFHVCITSYKLVMTDQHMFRRMPWVYLILDEAQNIKNFKSQRWQILLNFRTRRRLLLTGTPLQNSLMELWSLMHFLMPNVFQSHSQFRDWFANPVTSMVEAESGRAVNEELIGRLHSVLRPFLLRRLKKDVEKQLPRKVQHLVPCSLSRRQQFLYDEFVASSDTQRALSGGSFFGVANILMQLRKVCNHPDLFAPRAIDSPFCTVTPLVLRLPALLSGAAAAVSAHASFATRACTGLPVSLAALQLLGEHTEAGDDKEQWQEKEDEELEEEEEQTRHQCKEPPEVLLPFTWSIRDAYGANALLRPLSTVRLHGERSEMPVTSAPLRAPLYADSLLRRASGACPMTLPPTLAPSLRERVSEVWPECAPLACAIPRVLAPVTFAPHIAAPSSLVTRAMHDTGLRELRTVFHPCEARERLVFPDRRLLQYDCGKLQALAQLLAQLRREGHRALIFTQMTRMLDVLESFVNMHYYSYLRLDGSTKVDDRQMFVEKFNRDERFFLFLLSTRSGGFGVNLTGADTVIFYDSDWNPAMDAQAQDRCHRIGQTREVHIYRLITEHTIEENILRKAQQKRALTRLVITDGGFTTDFFQSLDLGSLIKQPAAPGSAYPPPPPPAAVPVASEKEMEEAIAKAEDEVDVVALKQAQLEQAAEFDDFEEEAQAQAQSPPVVRKRTAPGDEGTAAVRQPRAGDDTPNQSQTAVEDEDAPVARATRLEDQLAPLQRYAFNFLENVDRIVDDSKVDQIIKQTEEKLHQQDRKLEESTMRRLRQGDNEDDLESEFLRKRPAKRKKRN
eukprot:TRINITY_DN367_c0_g1_i1.p1 TRINITY_DN367_c0_g1~~TRINITY_DN367_c0_g1_i1.p1  ORF type:complete len:1920 (+),score=577.29 TRINITY_DN367_c0_g1_i1:54-5762(+)